MCSLRHIIFLKADWTASLPLYPPNFTGNLVLRCFWLIACSDTSKRSQKGNIGVDIEFKVTNVADVPLAQTLTGASRPF